MFAHGEFSNNFSEMDVPVAELNPSCAIWNGKFPTYSPVCHCCPQDQGPTAMQHC